MPDYCHGLSSSYEQRDRFRYSNRLCRSNRNAMDHGDHDYGTCKHAQVFRLLFLCKGSCAVLDITFARKLLLISTAHTPIIFEVS